MSLLTTVMVDGPSFNFALDVGSTCEAAKRRSRPLGVEVAVDVFEGKTKPVLDLVFTDSESNCNAEAEGGLETVALDFFIGKTVAIRSGMIEEEMLLRRGGNRECIYSSIIR